MIRFAFIPFLVVTMSCAQPTLESWEEAPELPDLQSVPASKAEILKQRVEHTNNGDFAAWEALHTAECTRFAPELDEPIHGAPGMRAAIERLHRAFPDYRLALVRAVGDDRLVAAEFIARGTMTGPLETGDGMLIPATGKSFTQRWMAMLTFDGDRISEIREYYDQDELNREVLFGGP